MKQFVKVSKATNKNKKAEQLVALDRHDIHYKDNDDRVSSTQRFRLQREIETLAFEIMPAVSSKNVHIGPVVVVPDHDEDEVQQLRDSHWIGPYVMDHVLGQGAFGTVHAGHTYVTNRTVAIKVIEKEQLFCSWTMQKRLNAEIGLLRHHGHHSNIISLYDVCRIVLKLTQRLGKTRKSFQLYFLCIVSLLAILNMYLYRVCYGRQDPYLLTTMSALTPIVHLFGS